MNWPWKKFEALYEAYMRREQSDKALLERNAYITGLLANTNLDDGKNTKKRLLENVDNDFINKLKSIYNIDSEEEDDLKNNPLFAAIKVPGEDAPVADEATEPESTTTTENKEIV